jgi:hypothetical protein
MRRNKPAHLNGGIGRRAVGLLVTGRADVAEQAGGQPDGGTGGGPVGLLVGSVPYRRDARQRLPVHGLTGRAHAAEQAGGHLNGGIGRRAVGLLV